MTPHNLVDATVGVIGDTHGDFVWTTRALTKVLAQGVRQVHVLGDFAFVWHASAKERKLLDRLTATLADADAHLYVTGGNHEGYAALYRHYPADDNGYRNLTDRITWLPRGWRGHTAAGTRVASLGGANSVNKDILTPPKDGHGGNWWPEEQITDADLDTLGTDPVDVLLAHDAPRSQALQQQLHKTVGFWTPAGLAYADIGQQMFHRGVTQVRPKLVLSGHYHLFLDTTETFHTWDGDEFETRSIILNCNGHPRSTGILNIDTQTLRMLPTV